MVELHRSVPTDVRGHGHGPALGLTDQEQPVVSATVRAGKDSRGGQCGSRQAMAGLPKSALSSSSSFKPLAPAANNQGPLSVALSADTARLKKRCVAVACLLCRKAKAKCDGGRPACGRCSQRSDSTCSYEGEPDDTRKTSLKRKREEKQEKVHVVAELFEFLRTRPESEAQEVLRRIRSSSTADFKSVLKFAEHYPLTVEQRMNSAQTEFDARMDQKFDRDALLKSKIKVRARPWTCVAGDGMVSELISNFFEWDHVFYMAFIDKQGFLADMTSGNLSTARYCSPLLVNAICAMRTNTSNVAKALGTNRRFDLRAQFLEEAKRWLDVENERPSIPTIQALLIMFNCIASMGQDQIGNEYRMNAYAMFKEMDLESVYERMHGDQADSLYATFTKRALSTAIWGVYCYESLCNAAYRQLPMLPTPRTPRYFAAHTINLKNDNITSIDADDFHALVFNELCNVCYILNRIAEYNKEPQPLGSTFDLQARINLYNQLQHWKKKLNPCLQVDNFQPATFYLSTCEHVAVLNLFQSLSPSLYLPNDLGSASDQCIAHCVQCIDSFQSYITRWPLEEYSLMLMYPLYNVTLCLAPRLNAPGGAHNAFAKACGLLHLISRDFKIAAYLLQALLLMVHKYGYGVPKDAAESFQNLGLTKEALEEPKIGFVVPRFPKGGEQARHSRVNSQVQQGLESTAAGGGGAIGGGGNGGNESNGCDMSGGGDGKSLSRRASEASSGHYDYINDGDGVTGGIGVNGSGIYSYDSLHGSASGSGSSDEDGPEDLKIGVLIKRWRVFEVGGS